MTDFTFIYKLIY